MNLSASRNAHAAGVPLAIATAVFAAFSSNVAAQSEDKKLEPVVVTATRTQQKAIEVLSDNVVITSEEIAHSGHRTLADLLQGQRGIEILRNGGPGANTTVYMRGAENKQNIVLIDGVRTGSTTSGGATWANIPLSLVDRIEIVYGPMSSLYGSDAIGGVIQVFTRKGDGAPKPTVMAGFGSRGERVIEAGISGSGERFHYALSAAHEEANGISAKKRGASDFNPDRDGYDKDGASGRFGFEYAKGHEVGANFMRSRLDAQYDRSPTRDDHNMQNIESYAIFSKNRFLPVWSSHLQIGRSEDRSTTYPTELSRIDTRQAFVSWQNDITIAGDLLQLILENREEEANTNRAAVNRRRTTDSVSAAYHLKRGAHLANLGVRNDDSSQYGSKTTGSVAYGYRFTSALRASASYGTSFRAPTFNELYFPSFGYVGNKPEKGRNAEAGTYYDDGRTRLSAVYYRNRITDLIVTARPCPATPSVPASSCAYNVNKALLTGLTLSAATRAGDLGVRATLDLQDPRDETTNRRLQRRAKRHGTIAVEHGAGPTNVGAEVVFSGDRFDEAANTNRLGGYGLLNLYASHDFTPGWTLFGRWNNVFDKNYELARNFATEGSTVFAGVRYGFR